VSGGSPEALQRYSEPFIKVVENRVKERARTMALPVETLRRFLRKEIAIAGVPAAAIPLLQGHLQRAGQEGT
jgi:intergrase/recombinase